jgi:Gram-negative bacterial TonB protein C-terminal
MLWLLFLAQLSAPSPTRVLFSNQDVPIGVFETGKPVSVPFRLTLAPNGRILDCKAESPTDNPALNAHTCTTIRRRGPFQPATQDGKPVYGVYRSVATFSFGDDSGKPLSYVTNDLDISLSRLPKGMMSQASVAFTVAVDATGKLTACQGKVANADPSLVKIGCDQLVRTYKAVPAATAAGIPVESVQTAVVLFTKG